MYATFIPRVSCRLLGHSLSEQPILNFCFAPGLEMAAQECTPYAHITSYVCLFDYQPVYLLECNQCSMQKWPECNLKAMLETSVRIRSGTKLSLHNILGYLVPAWLGATLYKSQASHWRLKPHEAYPITSLPECVITTTRLS